MQYDLPCRLAATEGMQLMRARQPNEPGDVVNTGVRIYCVHTCAAVRELTHQGLRARRLADGYPEWKRAGLPIAAGRGDDLWPESF